MQCTYFLHLGHKSQPRSVKQCDLFYTGKNRTIQSFYSINACQYQGISYYISSFVFVFVSVYIFAFEILLVHLLAGWLRGSMCKSHQVHIHLYNIFHLYFYLYIFYIWQETVAVVLSQCKSLAGVNADPFIPRPYLPFSHTFVDSDSRFEFHANNCLNASFLFNLLLIDHNV